MVGSLGILLIVFSVCVGIGFTSLLGRELSVVSLTVVPFLMLMIGVDNIFIVSAAEKEAKQQATASGREPTHEEILGNALREAGPNITVAAVTESAAFMVGVTAGVPTLTTFCIAAAVAVLTGFLFQVTAFVAVLELDHRRTAGRRLDCLPCFDLVKSPKEPTRNIMKRFIKKVYVPCVFNTFVQVVLVLGFICIALLSLWSYKELGLGLTQQVIVKKHSEAYEYFNKYSAYGESGPLAYIVVKDIDYTNTYNGQILDQMDGALSHMNRTVQPPVYSWRRGFRSYLTNNEGICNNTNITDYDFATQVKMYLQVKIDSVCCKKHGICGEQYTTDIVFNEEGTRIKASRYRFQHTALTSQRNFIDASRDTRHAIGKLTENLITQANEGKHQLAFGYSAFYVDYDQYTTIRATALENLFLALGAVLFCIEALTLNVPAAAIVSLMVFGTTWGLVGFCYVWNEAAGGYRTEMNIMSVVNLAMCSGVAVEFCVHLMNEFLMLKGTRQERAKKAVVRMGSTVITGIVSAKLIGIIVLGLAPGEVFKLYYFRMYLGVLVLGAFHSLAVQPVLLYWVGPASENGESMKVTLLRSGNEMIERSESEVF